MMRNWLAQKLAPKMARDAERYRRMISHISSDKQWLGEFPDAYEAMHRIECIDHDYWAPIGSAVYNYRFGQISDFREELRRRARPTQD